MANNTSELDNGPSAIIPIALMSAEGVIGNLLLIAAIVSDKKLHTYIDVFVMNVSIMDLIVCGILLPGKIPFLIYNHNIYSDYVCNFFAVLAIASCTGSVVSLAAVAVNKYLYVCHHNWYAKVFSRKTTAAIIAFAWVYSFSISCPPALGWSRIVYNSASASCTLHTESDVAYKIFLAVFGLGIPTFITSNCYFGIFLKLYRSQRKVNAGKDTSNSSKKNLRQVYTMFLISSLFSVSWFPYCIVHFMREADIPPLFARTATWMGLSNSCMNCIVLVIANKNYQQAYRKLLCCGKHRTTKKSSVSISTQMPVTAHY